MEDRYFRKIYSHREFYRALVLLFRSIKYLRLNRKEKWVSPLFQERIMLAVTQVNGCEACSWAHTKFALEEGMAAEEIGAILDGDLKNIPEEERVAVLFGQHYADQKGQPSKEAWARLVEVYGPDRALVILGVIRMMMVGNIYGMAVSGLADRFRRKRAGKTSLFYELSILLAIFFYLPAAAIHAGILGLLRKPHELYSS